MHKLPFRRTFATHWRTPYQVERRKFDPRRGERYLFRMIQGIDRRRAFRLEKNAYRPFAISEFVVESQDPAEVSIILRRR